LAVLVLKPVRYYLSSEKNLYHAIKNIFGYYPGNIFLYKLAFLHKSVGTETATGSKINNERLEFLGDAVLDAVIADYLFKTFPVKDEGFLTEMRSKIVSRVSLNKLAQRLGLDTLIQLVANSSNVYRSCQGDAFEALIGAMYLDKGFRFTRKILLDRVINQFFNINELVNQEVNFKSRMIEWSQKEKKVISFVVADEIGSGYRKQYVVDILLDGEPLAQGRDYSIKGAEQSAAEKAWVNLTGEPAGNVQ
jgi:ribonuclease III